MAMRTLRITDGPSAGERIEVEREIVVGREGDDLRIEDAELSRRHLALRPVENGVEVEDLGSLNGTFLDGRRLTVPVVVTATARLKLGTSQASLEVSLPQVTRAAPV